MGSQKKLVIILSFALVSVISASTSDSTDLITYDQSQRLKTGLWNQETAEDLKCDDIPQIAVLTPQNPQVNYTCFTTTYDNMLMIKDIVRPLNTSSDARVQFIVIVQTGMDREYVLYSEILGPNTTSVTTYSACEVTYLKSQVSVTHQAVLLQGSEATVTLQQTLGNANSYYVLTTTESVFLQLNTSYQETSLNCTGCNQFFSFVIPSNGVANQAYTITITVTSSFAFPFSSISIAGGSYCPDMQSTSVHTEEFGGGVSGASITFYGAGYGSWFVSCSTVAANVSYSILVDGDCDVVSKWCSDKVTYSSSSSGYEVPALVLYIVGGISFGVSMVMAAVLVILYSRKRGQPRDPRKNNNSFDFRPNDDEIKALVRDYDDS